MTTGLQDYKALEALPDSKSIVQAKFGNQEFTNQDSITIFNRESTSKGSPITKTFTLNYDNINQAVLKVNLLADSGKILGFIPNEFKLVDIRVNDKLFYPSDPRQSTNVIEKINLQTLNKTLIPNGENSITINFNAPIGAGVTSPNAEISAFLIVNGKRGLISPNDLINSTEITKFLQSIVKDNLPLTIVLIVLAVIALIAIAVIFTRAPSISEVKSLSSVVKL